MRRMICRIGIILLFFEAKSTTRHRYMLVFDLTYLDLIYICECPSLASFVFVLCEILIGLRTHSRFAV